MAETVLPDGWVICSIGDLCSKVTDGSHNPPKASETGLPMLSAKNIHSGRVDFSRVHRLIPSEAFEVENNRTDIQTGDVLLTIVGALGRTAVITADLPRFTLQRSVAVLAAPQINSGAFRYSLEDAGFQSQIFDNAKGTAQKGIYLKKLRELQLPLAPLAEQKVIADKLDSLLTQVETTKARLDRVPDILKRFRQSVLAAAVSGRLTEEWRGKKDFGKQVLLGDVVGNGPQNGLYKPAKFYGSGTKILRIDGFYDGEIVSWSKIKRVETSESEFLKWKLDLSDILINRVNSIEYLGKCALVRELPEDAVFESNIMRMSIDSTKAIAEFVVLFLRSVQGLEELRKNAKLAVNQASINQTDVKNCEFILPTIKEQTEIVRRVEELFAHADKIEQQTKAATERVNKLTQSILAKAFRGELTKDWRAANYDLVSGENSAEALLEKIKVEREAMKPKKRAKKVKG